MKFLRSGISLVWLVAVCLAQSPYNSIAHGMILDRVDASSIAQGSTGLIPSHNSQFSSLNPATWSSVKFASLTAHYHTGEIEYAGQDFKHGFGRLAYAAFIVPIKGEFAWGMGLRPYTRKVFALKDDEFATIVFSGDTLTLAKEIHGGGGISTLFTGGSWRIDKTKALGIQWDILFGVATEETFSRLDTDFLTTYRRRFRYKGTLLSLFFTMSPDDFPLISTFYLAGQFPVGPGKVVETNYHLFLDLNFDGFADRPLSSDIEPETRVHSSLSLPWALSAGWVYHMTPRTHLGVEAIASRFQEKTDSALSSIDGRAKAGSRVAVGLLREGVSGSRNFLGRFHYRVGFFERQHYISQLNEALRERGIALGISIPFGLTQNQIDFGFRYSKQEGFLSGQSGFVRQFAVGVTLGDIWLVKRRGR